MIKFLFLIYQNLFSPMFGLVFNIQCRYEESCSRYTQRMIDEHGLFKGAWMGLKRFISCNPFTIKGEHIHG